MRSLRQAVFVAIVATAAGCTAQSASVPSSEQPAPLDSVDQAVVMTLIQRQFIQEAEASKSAGPILVAGTTLGECPSNDQAGGKVDCLVRPQHRMFLRTHRPFSLNLNNLFADVSPRRVALPQITGVRVVSPDDPDYRSSEDHFYRLTAPIRFSARHAVIFFRSPRGYSAFAYLVREKNGWVIREFLNG